MIRRMEELSMNAWPALQTKLYDGWILRFSEGYTRRANSVSPIYTSTIDLEEKIDFCEKQYAIHNLPAIFKLTKSSNPEDLDACLEKRGYIKQNETSLRAMDLSQYVPTEVQAVLINDNLNESWLKTYFHCSDISDLKIQLTARQILSNILGPVIYVSKQVEGKLVGCGYGAIEGDYMGIFDIVVDEAYRGKGYGKDLMNGIVGAASEKNVKTAYLQVSGGNVPAENLYEKLGFKELYTYWYRKKL